MIVGRETLAGRADMRGGAIQVECETLECQVGLCLCSNPGVHVVDPMLVVTNVPPEHRESKEQLGEARQELKARAKRQRDRNAQLAAEVPEELRAPKATQKLGLWEDLSEAYNKTDKTSWECWRDGMDCVGECKVDESWEDRDKKDPLGLEIDEFESVTAWCRNGKTLKKVKRGMYKLNSDDYVDDFTTFVKRGLGKDVTDAMLELLEELGLPAMLEKVEYGLQLEVLGLMFSVVEGEPVIFLTEKKKTAIKEVIDSACEAGVVDVDVLDKLVGRLTFVLSAIADRALSPVMRPLRRMLSKEERVVDFQVRTALVALREIVDLDIKRKVAFEDFSAPSVVLYTDASWERNSGWLGAVLAIDGKFYGVREKVTRGMLHDDYCVWALNYLETIVAVFAAKFYASKLKGRRFDHAIDNTCAQGWLLSQGSSSDKKKWYLAAASAQYWAEAAKHQFRPWIVRVPSHFNVADYPTREDLLQYLNKLYPSFFTEFVDGFGFRDYVSMSLKGTLPCCVSKIARAYANVGSDDDSDHGL
eukprot:g18945.t1